MKVKTVETPAIYWYRGLPHSCINYYKTYITDNGNMFYMLNGKEITKEDGNKFFLKAKEEYPKILSNHTSRPLPKWYVKTSTEDIKKEDLIKFLTDNIDECAHFIDDFRQQEIAEENNRRFRRAIEWLQQNS